MPCAPAGVPAASGTVPVSGPGCLRTAHHEGNPSQRDEAAATGTAMRRGALAWATGVQLGGRRSSMLVPACAFASERALAPDLGGEGVVGDDWHAHTAII